MRSLVSGLRPVTAAIVRAAMMIEESRDSLTTQIRRSEATIARQYHRIGEDDSIAIEASLEIAEHELTARDVIRVMRQCLQQIHFIIFYVSGPTGI